MAATRRFTIEERRARLAFRHRLVPSRRTDDVVQIATDLVALHSTDPVSVYLSATARMAHPSLTPIDTALYDDRTLMRHHAMRRTLWVFAPHIARLAHASATVGLMNAERRTFLRLLDSAGIDDGEAWIRDARRDVLGALDMLGVATARQIGDAVPALKVPLALSVGKAYEGTQSAHSRLLLLLGFDGAVVRVRPTGSWINGQYRWTAMDSWVPGGVIGEDPVAAAGALADLWLRAFGPATATDLQWWMGWNGGTTTKALATSAAEAVALDDGPGWVAAGDGGARRLAQEPWVALLPGLDPTTMGWKRRDWYLDPTHASQLFDRNGNGGHTIWADGRIVGGWVQRKDGTIACKVLEDLGSDQKSAIDHAAGELESLLGPTRFSCRFPAPLQTELLR